GLVGELYLGGEGLARGYKNRPDLTADSFIPDPFSPLPGSRLYRSGDLARLLPDSNISFLGRRDNQVKIRGFRFELAEIEAVLSLHPAVRQCAVLALADPAGHKRLVAYLLLNPLEWVKRMLKQWVEEESGQQILITGVPNRRLVEDMRWVEMLKEGTA